MPEHPSPTTSGHTAPGIYTRLVMRTLYPLWVHGLCHRLAWGVSNRWLRRAYRLWPGHTHLSVGPGNGTFLRHLPAGVRELHLLDFSPHCLHLAARAVHHRRGIAVRPHLQDVLDTWKGLDEGSVDSVDCVMVAHCLPGASLAEKRALFCEAYRVLRPGGRFFGATVLTGGPGVGVNAFARWLIGAYTRRGWFSNQGDTSTGLVETVRGLFPDADVQVQGCTGVWTAVKR
ncbi:class I SAM-dependent methyltransferase [Nocardiopsis sp. CNT312]|uniref:class I SAM-dependent methyltransferase n=1 Tax=Nocardiopsis sp. CNT312 TaxID=1137268 RepID=UPI0004BB07A7|nr:class I SAM-dependent methyltransferase [Nocardiopsis sp. CNT312]